MRSFKHSGDLGDIIYSLPLVQLVGGGIYYLSRADFTRTRIGPDTIKNVGPLLECQPYISKVALWGGQSVAFDLDQFRWVGVVVENIASRHLRAFGLPEQAIDLPWLTVTPQPVAPVVINLTLRYRNFHFPWRKVVQAYRDKCVFVGTRDEHGIFTSDHGDVPYYPTKNMLDLAQVIAGANLFLGNQSAPYAIAEGLKMPTIQEVCLEIPNCIFQRDNAQYIPGKRIELPEL